MKASLEIAVDSWRSFAEKQSHTLAASLVNMANPQFGPISVESRGMVACNFTETATAENYRRLCASAWTDRFICSHHRKEDAVISAADERKQRANGDATGLFEAAFEEGSTLDIKLTTC